MSSPQPLPPRYGDNRFSETGLKDSDLMSRHQNFSEVDCVSIVWLCQEARLVFGIFFVAEVFSIPS